MPSVDGLVQLPTGLQVVSLDHSLVHRGPSKHLEDAHAHDGKFIKSRTTFVIESRCLNDEKLLVCFMNMCKHHSVNLD